MKSGIQIAGVSNQIRKGMIKGMEVWIKSHHLNVNFRYFIRHLPRKMFNVNAIVDTINMFMIQRYEYLAKYYFEALHEKSLTAK
jgi:hypothetical protein